MGAHVKTQIPGPSCRDSNSAAWGRFSHKAPHQTGGSRPRGAKKPFCAQERAQPTFCCLAKPKFSASVFFVNTFSTGPGQHKSEKTRKSPAPGPLASPAMAPHCCPGVGEHPLPPPHSGGRGACCWSPQSSAPSEGELRSRALPWRGVCPRKARKQRSSGAPK